MSLLGQIVAGESATPTGQQAVLNVIQNRAATNYGGYGTSLISQATAPYQFSAYPNALGSPTPTTEAMVSAANAGTLGNIVPNSLNYANPSLVTNPSSWVWGAQASGQGVTIGGNTFWANGYGGSPGYDPSQVYSANTNSDGTNISPQGTQSDPFSIQGDGTPSNYGDITGYQVGGVNAPYTTPTGATYDPTTGGFSDPSSMFGGAGGGIGGGGGGANIVTTSGQASGVAGGGDTLSATGTSQKMQWSDYGVAAVAQGSAAVANATSGAIKSVGSSITTWLGAQFSNVGQWFFRGVGVLFGIVLILGAFALMAFSGRRTA